VDRGLPRPEATPIEPARLARIPAEALSNVRFTLHPSLRLVRSRFAALTIWAMHRDSAEQTRVDSIHDAQDILVVRPRAEVLVHSLPPGAAVFIDALLQGDALVDAAGKPRNPTPTSLWLAASADSSKPAPSSTTPLRAPRRRWRRPMFTPSARPHMPDTLARTSDPRPTIGSRVIQLCSDVAPPSRGSRWDFHSCAPA
jgi:hypothetical protein